MASRPRTPLSEGPGPDRLRALLGRTLTAVVALAVIALGEALPGLRRLDRVMARHEAPLLAVTIGATTAGFLMLMGGAIHMAVTAGRWSGSGARAAGEASFREIKAAWRSGAWRRGPRWRRLFVMGAGGLLMGAGLFGLAVVLGPPGVKLLCGGALVYAVVRTVRAFRRA